MLKKILGKTKTPAKVSRTDTDYRTPVPNFKGQRRDPLNMTGSLPASKTTMEMRYRTGPIHTLHPRDIRIKSWLSMLAYATWYIGVFCFIAYRLSTDDLDTLEKQARLEVEIRKKIQKEFSD